MLDSQYLGPERLAIAMTQTVAFAYVTQAGFSLAFVLCSLISKLLFKIIDHVPSFLDVQSVTIIRHESPSAGNSKKQLAIGLILGVILIQIDWRLRDKLEPYWAIPNSGCAVANQAIQLMLALGLESMPLRPLQRPVQLL